MCHYLVTHARKFMGGSRLLDAPQTPTTSRSSRSSAGGLPLTLWHTLPHLVGILPILQASTLLLLHVVLSIWGRVFILNARMKLPPLDVSSNGIGVRSMLTIG
jgi:hypothetical protein